MHGHASPKVEQESEGISVDLGEGVLLPRAEAVDETVPLLSCEAPATVYFVQPSPHGSDVSLSAPSNPADRIFYAFRGRVFGGRLALMQLGVAYFTRRALGVFRLPGGVRVEELAVKIIVPAGCGASPEDVVAALRQEAKA